METHTPEHDPTRPDGKPRIILPPGVSYPEPKKPAPSQAKPTPEPAAEEPVDGPEVETLDADGNPTEPTVEDRLAEVEEQLALKDKDLQLLHAEFENFRKRLRRTHDEQLRYAAQGLMADLLQALDNFDHAMEALAGSDTPQAAAWREGFMMVRNGLWHTLEKHGVTRMAETGIPFDPNLHEILSVQEDAEQPPQTILSVIQPGYRLHDRVVRPARVVVAVPPKTAEGMPETPPPVDTPDESSPDADAD